MKQYTYMCAHIWHASRFEYIFSSYHFLSQREKERTCKNWRRSRVKLAVSKNMCFIYFSSGRVKGRKEVFFSCIVQVIWFLFSMHYMHNNLRTEMRDTSLSFLFFWALWWSLKKIDGITTLPMHEFYTVQCMYMKKSYKIDDKNVFHHVADREKIFVFFLTWGAKVLHVSFWFIIITMHYYCKSNYAKCLFGLNPVF